MRIPSDRFDTVAVSELSWPDKQPVPYSAGPPSSPGASPSPGASLFSGLGLKLPQFRLHSPGAGSCSSLTPPSPPASGPSSGAESSPSSPVFARRGSERRKNAVAAVTGRFVQQSLAQHQSLSASSTPVRYHSSHILSLSGFHFYFVAPGPRRGKRVRSRGTFAGTASRWSSTSPTTRFGLSTGRTRIFCSRPSSASTALYRESALRRRGPGDKPHLPWTPMLDWPMTRDWRHGSNAHKRALVKQRNKHETKLNAFFSAFFLAFWLRCASPDSYRTSAAGDLKQNQEQVPAYIIVLCP